MFLRNFETLVLMLGQSRLELGEVGFLVALDDQSVDGESPFQVGCCGRVEDDVLVDTEQPV